MSPFLKHLDHVDICWLFPQSRQRAIDLEKGTTSRKDSTSWASNNLYILTALGLPTAELILMLLDMAERGLENHTLGV